MILKMLRHDHGKPDEWQYCDNISSATIRFDEDIKQNVVDVRFKEHSGNLDCTMIVSDVSFLMSDEGKTIERLRPFVKPKYTANVEIDAKIKKVEIEPV